MERKLSLSLVLFAPSILFFSQQHLGCLDQSKISDGDTVVSSVSDKKLLKSSIDVFLGQDITQSLAIPFRRGSILNGEQIVNQMLKVLPSSLPVSIDMIRKPLQEFISDKVCKPVTNASALLAEKVGLALQNSKLIVTRGTEKAKPILELVPANFIETECLLCSKKLDAHVEVGTSCVKLCSGQFAHKNCFDTCLEKLEKNEIDEKITLEDASNATEIIPFYQAEQNLYQTLGLSKTASEEEIIAAHNKLIASDNLTVITDKLSLNYAFKILSNSFARKLYDIFCDIKNTGPVLELTFNQNEKNLLQKSFQSVIETIATFYPKRKEAMYSNFLGNIETQLKAMAKIHGFNFLLEELINPCENLPVNQQGSKIKQIASSFDFPKKLKFLCAFIEVAVLATEATIQTAVKKQADVVVVTVSKEGI